MRLIKTTVGLAAAAILLAGGVLAPVPAQAASVVAGKTGLVVPHSIWFGIWLNGVDMAPIAPAVVRQSGGSMSFSFPVAPPRKDGYLPHTGGFSLNSLDVALTFRGLQITYKPGPSPTSAQITAVIGGIPDGIDHPWAGANGSRIPVFDVTNFKVTNIKGTVTGSGKSWRRTDTQTMTGKVTVVNAEEITGAINSLLQVAVLTPGMDFGSLNTSWTNTITCQTKAACS